MFKKSKFQVKKKLSTFGNYEYKDFQPLIGVFENEKYEQVWKASEKLLAVGENVMCTNNPFFAS